jgi:hypothetical protein
MAVFLLYSCYNRCYKKIRKTGVPRPRCANPCYATLRGVFEKVLSVTLRYATQCENRAKNFLVGSMLYSAESTPCYIT